MESTKKSIGELKFWHVQIVWQGIRHSFGTGFTQPPTRKDIEFILRREWLKLPIEKQNQIWEVILICGFIPEIPWIGKIDTWYGSIECCERFLVANGPVEPIVSALHSEYNGDGSGNSGKLGTDSTGASPGFHSTP